VDTNGFLEVRNFQILVQSVQVLTGINQDKMSKKLKQYPQRNKFEMAAHDMDVNFKKKRSKPSHPHSIETYANPFKRKII
jgi:hypothetical protein